MFTGYIVFFVCLCFQYQLISTSDSCRIKLTCQECISDPSICVWCAENSNLTVRCMPQSSIAADWCPNFLQNPQNLIQELETKEFSSVSEHVIQMKPQRYKLTLRQGMPQSFNFSFQAAHDYPVDLYLLLDASKTMESIKNMTARKAEDIYGAIKSLTNNVHLGFGTFVDKRMLPIMSSTHDKITYSFRHRLKLVDDFKQFREKVLNTRTGVSRDPQEGGLDALAQVLVCKDIIGWRNESRKIVVFLTDGSYHAAGDGRNAGLFEPYDGQCYTEDGIYTKELEMDYPSVGMISKLASERDAIVIFLVRGEVKYIYDGLKRVVSGSQVAQLYLDSQMEDDAIVTILKNIYENISKKIKLIAKVRSGSKKNFKISFEPDCTTDDDSNPACHVEIDKEQHLVGTVQYDASENAVVDIVVEGTGEKLTLEIESIKSCDCERNAENNSPFCYGEKRVCGKCSCSGKRYGERCACVRSEKNGYSDNTTCIAAVGDDFVCSNRGSCVCGTCQCTDKKFTGKFCECNLDSCPRSRRFSENVCGGQKRGICDCGKCKCTAHWSGDACDCYMPDTFCKEHGTDIVCNGRGKCECGECACDPIADWDARSSQTDKCKVETCTIDCNDRQCVKLEKCAKCRRNGLEDCKYCDDRIRVEVVETLTEDHKNNSIWNMCSNVKVEIGCRTSFVYRYNHENYGIELVVTTKKDCAPTYYLFGGIFLLTVLLVGAGTLIAWKLLTDARDRHEYSKFLAQNKLDASSPNDNPVYRPPTTTFDNPAFRKKSVDVR